MRREGQGMSLFNAIPASQAEPLPERAFAELIERQQKPLLQLAMRLVGNWEEARDLAQTAFVRPWQRRERLQRGREITFYLRRILVNLCIDHLRGRGKRALQIVFEETQSETDMANPQSELEAREVRTRLWRSINALPAKQKTVLILRDVEGYSVAETAQMISCSQNGVLVNLHLARKNVKEKMRQWLAAQE